MGVPAYFFETGIRRSLALPKKVPNTPLRQRSKATGFEKRFSTQAGCGAG